MKLLNRTSEFNEVYFSEMGEAEATHSRDPRKINLGEERILLGKIAKRSFRTVKFLLNPFPIRKCGKPASAESKKRAFYQARRAIKNNNQGQENGIFNNLKYNRDNNMNSKS